MKRLFLFSCIFLFAISVFAQEYGVNYTMAAPTSKTQFFIPKYSTIKVTSTHIDYSVLKDLPAGTLISTAIADPTWLYPVGSTASSTATITTLTSTTATITNGTITTTLTLPGNETFTKTTGNANSTTHSGSFKVTDTLRIGSAQYLLQATINRLNFEGSVSATDTLFGRNAYIYGNKTANNLAEFINDANGSIGDSSAYINKYGNLYCPTVNVTGINSDYLDFGASDTLTYSLGRIVFIAADSSFYGCRSITDAKKYYKINP